MVKMIRVNKFPVGCLRKDAQMYLHSVCSIDSSKKKIVAAGSFGFIIQWDFESEAVIIGKDHGWLYSVCSCNDSIIAAGMGGVIQYRRELPVKTLFPETLIFSLCRLDNGIVAVGKEGVMIFWEEGFEVVVITTETLKNLHSVCCFRTRNGVEKAVAVGKDGIIIQWHKNLLNAKIIPSGIDTCLTSVCSVGSGTKGLDDAIVAVGFSGTLVFLQYRDSNFTAPQVFSLGNKQNFNSVCPFGSGVIVVGNGRVVTLWEPGQEKVKKIVLKDPPELDLRSICSFGSGAIAVGNHQTIFRFTSPWDIQNHRYYDQKDKIKMTLLLTKSFWSFLSIAGFL